MEFMEDLREWELGTIVDSVPYIDRGAWERMRFSVYAQVQSQSMKKLVPEEIMSFSWDKSKPENTGISKEDIERLKARAEEIKLKMKKNE